jgi:dTDP-4-dehydrorhamnose reductase
MSIQVLVSGGNGRLTRALSAVGSHHVKALTHGELDITDALSVKTVLVQLRPRVVINAAAISSVDTSETATERATAVNALAPGQMAQICAAMATPFIHISTDYVFGGSTERPWRESDPVSPVNNYGRSKAEGEQNVLAVKEGVCVARVAWLFGDGSDFISYLLRSDSHVVKVASDQIGSPTPIFPLARRLLDLAERMTARDAVPRILHLAGSPAVSRADWVAAAFQALQLAGRRTPEIERVTMADLASTTQRPRYSALDCSLAAELFGGELDWRSAMAQPGTFAAAFDQ